MGIRLLLVLVSIFFAFGTLTAVIFIISFAEYTDSRIKKALYYSFCVVIIIGFSYVECEIVRAINGVF